MTSSPFERLLGAEFARLPEPVRRLHSLRREVTTAGRADITTSPGLLPWLICLLAGLPRAGRDISVTVSFHPDGRGGEYWRRCFARRRYASGFEVGDGVLVEHFAPMRLHHRLTASKQGLAWRLIGWSLFGVPLPRCTVPTAECFESADGERFVFDIDAAFPIVGPVIHYRGWLLPVEGSTED